nr:glycosyltransferase family 4 protein [Propionibacterium sp.]
MGLRPRVAIAHDYLTQRGGAERVVLTLLKAFPDAPLYTTLYEPDNTFPEFRDARIVTSWLNKVPLFRRDHRAALPLLPLAVDSLRIDADIVVASSSGWAHGFPTTGRTLVYCHSPARFVYLTDEYLGAPAHTSAKGLALLALRPALARWDRRHAHRAAAYLANSTVVRNRLREVYGIEAEVLSPPAGVDPEGPQSPVPDLADWRAGYHLVVSRLLPYKNVRQVVDAFRELDERLVIVGRGPLRDEIAATLPPNARLLSGLDDAQLRWVYAHAQALIAPSFEDFGLTPLEAGCYGKPTLALRGGGYLDTVTPGQNGSFFETPDAAAIAAAVRVNRGATWDPVTVRACADAFSEARFVERLREIVDRLAEQA